MTHIEQLHLDAINNAEYIAAYSLIPLIEKSVVSKKSAEITEQIACDFIAWVERNKLDSSGKYLHLFHLSYKDLFQEYLKSKENETTTNTY